jgi:predicted  nucleic acid-binding Zn-ribbon protein
MKSGKTLMAATLTALLLTAACDKSAGAKGDVSANQSGVDVDVSYSDRSNFVSKMKSELNDVNGEIQRLSTKTSNATDNASAEAKSRLEALKDKSKDLNVQIEKVQNATESTWADVKASSQKAMDQAKDSLRSAKDWTAQKLQEAGQKLESK